MNIRYGWAIEGDAYRYLAGSPKRQRRSLERAIEFLASHPFHPSLFSDRSDDGTQFEVIEMEGHFITYHVDHAVRRVRVIELHPGS